MQKNINFISSQTQQKVKLVQWLRSIMLLLVGLLILAAVIYCISVPVLISYRTRINRVDTEIEQAKKAIDEKRQLESMLQTIKSRSSIVADVSKKTGIARFLDMVMQLSEKGYRFKTNIEAVGFDKEIEVIGGVADPKSLAEVALFMDQLKNTNLIKNYTVDTITRQPDGGYDVTVIINKQY